MKKIANLFQIDLQSWKIIPVTIHDFIKFFLLVTDVFDNFFSFDKPPSFFVLRKFRSNSKIKS